MTAVSVTKYYCYSRQSNDPLEVSMSSSLEPVAYYDTQRIEESKAHRSKKTMTTSKQQPGLDLNQVCALDSPMPFSKTAQCVMHSCTS